jgi:hypothetical protein
MDLTNFAIAFFILMFSVLSIATSSIAIECYNKSPELKSGKPNNYIFIIVNLVMAILLTLLCIKSMYNIYSAGFA